jgi:2-oxoglutarate dehydrogenase E1 component
VLGILVHGDAAFSGQGVVSESLALSTLSPFYTYGIIHLVINNQIGFTANAVDTKTGLYATEIAKIIGAPIIHVNGEDLLAVTAAIKIALQYRAKFQKDIVIDVIGYRKYGHNEGDEPLYTQPLMYQKIRKKQSIAQYLLQDLQQRNIISQNVCSELVFKISKIITKKIIKI